MALMNYYDELGIAPAATEEEIQKAYRRLARLLHPDQQPEEALKLLAERQMMRLNSIADVLLDPSKRLTYDAGFTTVIEPAPAPPITLVVPVESPPTPFSRFRSATAARLQERYPRLFDSAQKALTSIRLVSRVSWACGLSLGLSLLIWALARSAYHNPSPADAASVVHANSRPLLRTQKTGALVPRRATPVPVIVAQASRPEQLVLSPIPAKMEPLHHRRPFSQVLVLSPVQPRVVQTQPSAPTPSINWTAQDATLPSDDLLGTKQSEVPGPPNAPPSEVSAHGKRNRHQSGRVN